MSCFVGVQRGFRRQIGANEGDDVSLIRQDRARAAGLGTALA
jgi:hypothetical protein